MKKIKRLEDIEREKMRLRVQQLEQEQSIRNEWQELKHALSPGTLLRNKLMELGANRLKDAPILSGLLHIGASLLGRKTSE
jgi:predicted component of type VI protein secretion system